MFRGQPEKRARFIEQMHRGESYAAIHFDCQSKQSTLIEIIGAAIEGVADRKKWVHTLRSRPRTPLDLQQSTPSSGVVLVQLPFQPRTATTE
jgi:hypothetical protein